MLFVFFSAGVPQECFVLSDDCSSSFISGVCFAFWGPVKGLCEGFSGRLSSAFCFVLFCMVG